jgi:hypothetical protein
MGGLGKLEPLFFAPDIIINKSDLEPKYKHEKIIAKIDEVKATYKRKFGIDIEGELLAVFRANSINDYHEGMLYLEVYFAGEKQTKIRLRRNRMTKEWSMKLID